MQRAWVLLISRRPGTASADEKIVQEAAREATVFERKTIRAFSETALGELKKYGMQITELPPPAGQAARQHMAKYGKEFGEETLS